MILCIIVYEKFPLFIGSITMLTILWITNCLTLLGLAWAIKLVFKYKRYTHQLFARAWKLERELMDMYIDLPLDLQNRTAKLLNINIKPLQ